MQQFTVPQFIDVEDKVIGFITTRQFIILLGGGIFLGIAYKIFDFSLFLVIALFTAAVVAPFAFVKINGRPFHFFVINLVETTFRPHLRIWREESSREIIEYTASPKKEKAEKMAAKSYTRSRLAELSLIVDTGGMYRGEAGGAELKFLEELNHHNEQANNG